jgi:hypothetical protein
MDAERGAREHRRPAEPPAPAFSSTVRGSRMMVPDTKSGRVDDVRLTGSLEIMSVERRFTGARR